MTLKDDPMVRLQDAVQEAIFNGEDPDDIHDAVRKAIDWSQSELKAQFESERQG